MSVPRVRAITVRLLQQFRRDRRTLALLFLAPLVILGLLGYLLRGTGSVPAIAVVNEDQGPLGALVDRELHSSTLVTATDTSLATADSQLRSGSIAGYVRFRADFTQRALQGHIIEPFIRLEGSQPSLSQTVVRATTQALSSVASQAAAAGATEAVRFAPLTSYLYGGSDFDTLDYFGAGFIGLVVFFLVFVITAVAFLRERGQGTLERLMASPLRRGEIVLGYMAGFTVLALIQAVEVLLFSLLVLKVRNDGNVGLLLLMEALMAIGAVNLGIFLSMFARTEFQAVQFIPLVIVPQMVLSGIVFPVVTEPGPLRVLSSVLPLTYAVDGMRDIMVKGADLASPALQADFAVVLGFCLLVIAAGTLTLRRRIA